MTHVIGYFSLFANITGKSLFFFFVRFYLLYFCDQQDLCSFIIWFEYQNKFGSHLNVHKDVAYCFKQILEEILNKTVFVRPFTSHHTNHTKKDKQNMLSTAGEV